MSARADSVLVAQLVAALVACDEAIEERTDPVLLEKVRAAIRAAEEADEDSQCRHCKRHVDECYEDKCEEARYAAECDWADNENERAWCDERCPF